MKLRTWCIRMGQILTKTVLVCTGFLFFLTLINPATVQAEDDRGGITIRQQNVPIQKVFQTIEKQSGYRFFYNETLLQGAGKVTIDLKNVSLQVALEACFRNQPLSYAIVDKTIIVKRRPEQQPTAPVTVVVPLSKPGKIIAVRGKVTSNNVPVAGASIMIKGTDNGASTDKDGVFTLPEVDEDATLVISSVSHAVREVRLNGQTFISIDLSKRTDDLDEAVVVAYNTTTQRKNVGAVTVVKGDQVRDLPFRSVDKALQGQVPGLLVTSGTGQPGGGTSNFVLRGIATGSGGSFGSTVRNPLIVMDGIPINQDPTHTGAGAAIPPVINPMAQLNPSDIETISVLKDAAAIALYGSKASNGVILITTKKGKAGKTTFSFHQQTDIANRLDGKIKLLNKEEYLELLYETYKNTPRTPSPWTDELILADLKTKFPTMADGSFYPETDWSKELYNDRAMTYTNEFSISGGNEKSNFYLNLEYTKQDGIYIKTGYDRKSIRFNFENKPTDWFKIGLNTALSYNKQDYAALGASSTFAVGTNNSPLNPVRLENGTYYMNFTYPYQVANPVASADYNTKSNIGYRGLSKLYAELSFLKYFKLSSVAGVDFMLMESKEKIDPRLFDELTFTSGSGRIEDRDIRNLNFITTNTLRFDKSINNEHAINVVIGQEARKLSTKSLVGTASNLRFPAYDQISNGGTRTSEGGVAKENLLSYFTQINYGYKNKYLFTGSVRKDGSSNFGERERYGTYWSTGAAWVVSSEKFMQPTSSWLNYFKLRGSIGAAGNSAPINRFTRFDLLSYATYQNDLAVFPSSAGNPDIKWEQTFTWDAGAEARFWNERIAITADIYKRKTSDVIYTINLPFVTGYSTVLDNIGNIDNKGIELSLSVDVIRSRDLKWNISSNWSSNKNVLVKANAALTTSGTSLGSTLGNEEGRNFNSFYLVRWAGVNSSNGKALYIDSVGETNENFNAAKREFVGKPQPDGFGSITNTLNYKNFQLSALLYYQYGFQVYNSNQLNNDGSSPYANQDKLVLDRWQKPGDEAKNPIRLLNTANRNSTRYLYNGDFIRLQNVAISYFFPNEITSLLRLSTLKLYAQAYNLAVWTKFPGGDIGNIDLQGGNSLTYPNQRTYSVGVNLTF